MSSDSPRTIPRTDWQRLEPMLDALLDAAPSERPALLARLSGGDATLEAELAGLIAQCEQPHPVLDRSVGEVFGNVLSDELATFPESLTARYRVTEVVGQGGMAVVYLARDIKHDRDVAVKVVRSEVAATVGRDRFLREIAIVATLQHPHIVPLYDSGEADGSLYYVMPYEEGHSLRDRMSREGPLPIRDTVAVLRDVCDALAHAHKRGVIHRDIKPENVLLSGGHAMVADFGIARPVERSADGAATLTAGLSVGTPAYMPPEQIAADPSIDHRADIYAVGVVAYEMLAGRRPFDSATPQGMLAAHLTQTPEPLNARRPDVPQELAEVVAKCLEKRADERWQNMHDLLLRLDAIGAAATMPSRARRPSRARPALAGLGIVALALAAWLVIKRGNASWQNPLANARVERLTDLPGSELDAAISNDGRFAVFLADSGGEFDALVTQIGSGQFLNLTGGRLPELFNEDVRNVGFNGDGSRVWIRAAGIANTPSVSLVPTLGGQLRPFLERAVMAVWSPDGRRVAYHEGGNDPIFVADQDGRNARRIFVAPAGRHCHYLTWSPDAHYLYFSFGLPPDNMDIWRIPVDGAGGTPERITHHDATVAYPALLDRRTLLYVSTADDGTGPWLYSMDVDERVARRVTTGVEHTLSVAAAAPTAGAPRRLVTSVSNPTVNLWSVAVTDSVVEERDARPIDRVPTARARGPRFASDGSLFYLASRSGADGLWRLRNGAATELWNATQGAVVGAPVVSPDGRSVCGPVRRNNRSTLYCSTTDGTDGRVLAESLDVRGAGSWSPDGTWIAITAQDTSGGVRIYKVPLDGGPAVNLVPTVSSNPVWSPDGTFIVYSAVPRARTVPVLAVRPDGQPYPLPPITVDRIGDSYRFMPGSGRQLVLKQGGFRHQDFHLIDLTTGRIRPLTHLRGGESLLRFDVSPDGRQILFERVRENSDIVLIELPR